MRVISRLQQIEGLAPGLYGMRFQVTGTNTWDAQHVLFEVPTGSVAPVDASTQANSVSPPLGAQGNEQNHPWGDPATLESQCQNGDAEACHGLGHTLAESGAVERARQAFLSSCENDSAATRGEACSDLAKYFRKAPLEDFAQAALYDQKACVAGDAPGCFKLAMGYRDGSGVARDLATALELHGRACQLEMARACHYLAFLHHEGEEGAPQDHDLAEGFYQQACDLGVPQACVDLADCLEDTGDDLLRKLGLLQKSCHLESGAGCLAFTQLYEASDLGLPNEKNTIERYRALACSYGIAEACV